MTQVTSDDREELKLLGLGLPVGGSLRTLCPRCKGGSTKERSFRITRRTSGLTGRCYRGSCGYACSTSSTASTSDAGRSSMGTARGPATGTQPVSLSPENLRFLTEKFTLKASTLAELGVMFSEDEERYLYPLLSWQGLRFGWVARSYLSGVKKKALVEFDREHPVMSFFVRKSSTPRRLWIVEDLPSAIALYENNENALALSGTSLTLAMELELMKACVVLRFDKILIALDNDKAGHVGAMQIKAKLDQWVRNDVIMLHKDFKDMDQKERNVYLQS